MLINSIEPSWNVCLILKQSRGFETSDLESVAVDKEACLGV